MRARLIVLLLMVLLAWPAQAARPETIRGIGTIFGPWHTKHGGDPLAGSHAACMSPGRRAKATRAAMRLYRAGAFIAHPSWPCWTIVRICSDASGRCDRACIADRGPAHAMVDIWWRLAKRLRHDGGMVAIRLPAAKRTLRRRGLTAER